MKKGEVLGPSMIMEELETSEDLVKSATEFAARRDRNEDSPTTTIPFSGSSYNQPLGSSLGNFSSETDFVYLLAAY